MRKRIISESAALAKSRRVEAIQIVARSGPNADENHLRRLLAEGLDVHQSTAISADYTTIDSDAKRRAIERIPDILNPYP